MSSLTRRCRQLYLCYLSKPTRDRALYRRAAKGPVQKILEIGIGTALRAERLIWLASTANPGRRVTYTGIDLFESRSSADGPGTSLKAAHRRLVATGARARLVPGDPFAALARTANLLGTFDLVIISANLDAESLARSWFYVPRLLTQQSQVFVEQPPVGNSPSNFRLIARAEIDQLAARNDRRRAA